MNEPHRKSESGESDADLLSLARNLSAVLEKLRFMMPEGNNELADRLHEHLGSDPGQR
jgi:hypothetical protein